MILPDRKAYFCYVAPSQHDVTLGFEYGVFLGDPHRLLHGDGKQVRYIVVADPEDISEPQLATNVREAARLATLSRDERARLELAREAERDLEQRMSPANGQVGAHKLSGDGHDGTGRN